MESAPGGLGQLKLLADDYSDKSIDPEDIREDLKTELLTVHAALKQLNKDIDYSGIINPLIAEQGPAVQHIARLSRQIDRLNKVREQFQRDKQESLKIGNDSREIPVQKQRQLPRQKRQKMTIPAELIPTEVLPSWGILKRYSASMDKTTYLNVVYTAEWMFNCMLSHKEGPEACRMADLVSLAENIPQIPGGPQLQVKGYLTNEYLNFDNIKAAASAGDFRTVAVAYFRNEQLVAYRIENNPERQRFIAWAVSHLRTLGPACFISKQELQEIYKCLPPHQVRSMGLPTMASVNDFFRNRGGGGTACSSSDGPDGGREGDGAGLIPARRRLRVIPALRSVIALKWVVARALRVLRMGSWKGKRPELLYCKLAAAAIPKKVVHG